MKKVSIVLLMVAISVFLICDYGFSKDVRGVTDSEIRIGVIYDQTGPATPVTVPASKAFKNYFQWVNEKGGINGRKIKLIIEDDRYSIPATISAYKKLLLKDKVLVLLGPASSHGIFALTSAILKDKMPCVLPPSSDRVVIPPKRYMFASGPTYEDQIQLIFQYIVRDLKKKNPKIAFVYNDTEHGKLGFKAAEKYKDEYGIDIVSIEIVNPGVLDATSQALNIKRRNPDFIVMHLLVDNSIVIMKSAMKIGVKDIPFLGTQYTCTEDTVKVAGKAASNYTGIAIYSSWYDKGSAMEEMRKATLKYDPGTEKPYRPKAYTQGWGDATILAEGIKRAGKDIDGEALVDALESIKDFDMRGLCGRVTFGHDDHKGSRYVKMYKANVKEGLLTPISDWIKLEK
ncbi:MAG: amino acid/amide ABC transporter substrate-binding protein HAAT family [bacterium]|nr:MAG: amino acid/amide ABC transporter substrate-binding protein HAAT family [bacterium]